MANEIPKPTEPPHAKAERAANLAQSFAALHRGAGPRHEAAILQAAKLAAPALADYIAAVSPVVAAKEEADAKLAAAQVADKAATDAEAAS